MVKILHLTLKKKWFDLIKSGKKKVEYREVKDYWTARLCPVTYIKKFDFIVFRNGYGKKSPRIKVEWKGMDYEEFEGKMCYAIKLGKVVKIF